MERFNNKVVVECMSRDTDNSGLRITVEEFNVSAEATAVLQAAVTEVGLGRQQETLAKMKTEKIGENQGKGRDK